MTNDGHYAVNFFVDGHDYFRAVSHALSCSRKEIFITGWLARFELCVRDLSCAALRYITPEIFLTRSYHDDCAKLEDVLMSAAERGVKIFILTWNESKVCEGCPLNGLSDQ